MLQTGENEQAMRGILDMTRLISLVILTLHFYYYCYEAFSLWGIVSELSDRLLVNIQNSGIFEEFHYSKLISLGFLAISLLGARGRKDEKLNYKVALTYILTGLLIYFVSYLALLLPLNPQIVAAIYIAITMTGFLLLLSGGTLLSRIINKKLTDNRDIFNKENETFPQEERLLENEYSINLPARYRLKNKIRNSWINIINPFRGLLLLGSPGS